MPLTKVHIITGAAVGTAFCVLDKSLKKERIDPDMLAACFSLGALAGALPDILEPPLHRKHRSLFHSMAVLGAASAAIKNIDSLEDFDNDQKTLLKALALAYGSHLILDSRTRTGIPLLV